jgi:hypothetical protein
MAEVELPNPEELEELKGKTFGRRVALVTAIFAVLLALAALGGNHATKEMLLAQQRASDQWAFYQAKSIREHESRVHRQLLEVETAQRNGAPAPEVRRQTEAALTALGDEAQRYNTEKKEIEEEAKTLERERDRYRAKDLYFEYAEALLQIAIVMASIAIVSGSRPVFLFSLILAIGGGLLTVDGYTLLAKLPLIG